MHKHHIIPRHAGGTDDPENIIEVTVEDHFKLHYARWKEFKSYKDLFACQLLKNNWLSLTPEEIRINCSKGGKAAQKTLKKKQLSSFYDPVQRAAVAKLGREAAKLKGAGFYNSKLQSELGKRGGPKNKGFRHVTDGVKNIKYTVPMQKVTSVEQFIKENPQFRMGRTIPNKTCPHCQKVGKGVTMYRWHFDNCKYK